MNQRIFICHQSCRHCGFQWQFTST